MTKAALPRGGHCGVVVLVFVLDVGDHRDGLVVQLYEASRELGVEPRWRRRLLHLKIKALYLLIFLQGDPSA